MSNNPWQLAKGQTLTQISASSGAYIWGVDADGNAWRYRTTVDPKSTSGQLIYQWAQAPAPAPGVALSNISVGIDGTVYAVDDQGRIYTTSSGGGSGGPVDPNTKKQIMLPWTTAIGNLMQIAVGSSSLIWGLDTANNIYRAVVDGTGKITSWQKVDGSLKWISVAGDGTIYGVNSVNKIFKYTGGKTWTPVAGSLTQVSVGDVSRIWGINDETEIYQFVFNNGESGWEKVPGNMINIAVGGDGVVYGVGEGGKVYYYEE
ncbi:MAG TPA: tectonin domain-containing protein [Pyrinomonadaceae bacterium]|jgi:hypothetical protein